MVHRYWWYRNISFLWPNRNSLWYNIDSLARNPKTLTLERSLSMAKRDPRTTVISNYLPPSVQPPVIVIIYGPGWGNIILAVDLMVFFLVRLHLRPYCRAFFFLFFFGFVVKVFEIISLHLNVHLFVCYLDKLRM